MTNREEYLRMGVQLGKVGVHGGIAAQLVKIARSLHRIDEQDCNEEASEKRTRREEKLETKARALAAECECRIYRQGDPRGASLYILEGLEPDPERPDDSYYSSCGVALF